MIVSERIVQYRLNIFQITITFRILDAWQMDCTFFLGPTHLWPRKILILRCCLDLKSLMRDLRARVKEILVNLCYKTEGSFGWISNGGRLLKTDLTSEFSVAKIWSTDEILKMLWSSPFLLCVPRLEGWGNADSSSFRKQCFTAGYWKCQKNYILNTSSIEITRCNIHIISNIY